MATGEGYMNSIRIEFYSKPAGVSSSEAEWTEFVRLNEQKWKESIWKSLPRIYEALGIVHASEKKWGRGHSYTLSFTLPDLEDFESLLIENHGYKILVQLESGTDCIGLVHIRHLPVKTVALGDVEEIMKSVEKALGG